MNHERSELFVRLLTHHQSDLHRYIFTLLPNEEDARDVLQETSVAMCQKFAEYDATRPFLAWAYKFAYFEVLKYRKRNPRQSRCFDIELLERLVEDRSLHEAALQSRLQALEVCLSKLPETDRTLICERYGGGLPVEDQATQSGASRRSFFRNLQRIRGLLQDCIGRQVG
jgi:RNA polymerase sigma-70 factor (ECF subfamily)